MITTIMYGFMDQFTTFNKSPVFCILLKVVVHKFTIYLYTLRLFHLLLHMFTAHIDHHKDYVYCTYRSSQGLCLLHI